MKRQDTWDELMHRGVNETPEYGPRFVLVDRDVFEAMDRAMQPNWWERIIIRWRVAKLRQQGAKHG
jgi:hypothetical protein